MREASVFWKKNAEKRFSARNYPTSGRSLSGILSRNGAVRTGFMGRQRAVHPSRVCRRSIINALLVPALCALLAGCAGQAPLPSAPPSAPLPNDPQQCLSRAECTTKTSRTLLFVFDYAAAGAPLVQRDGRLLFTPVDAPATDWPALTIRLAEAEQSAFAFNAQCRAIACRLTVEQLLQIYRSYLADKPCAFSAALCRFD